MKKLFAILISLFLVSGVFAKQYIYTIKPAKKDYIFETYDVVMKVKEDLDKVLFDLILRGNKIVSVTAITVGGYTLGYTIVYEDNK